MFTRNEGNLDRALRIILGVALLAGFFLNTEAPWRMAYLIGIIPLATGLLGNCPIYSLLGLNTCPLKKK